MRDADGAQTPGSTPTPNPMNVTPPPSDVKPSSTETTTTATPTSRSTSRPPFPPNMAWWQSLLLTYVWPLVNKPKGTVLEEADVYTVDPSQTASLMGERLAVALDAQPSHRSPTSRLFRALIAITWRNILLAMTAGIVEAAADIARPLLLKAMLEAIEDDDTDTAVVFAASLFLASLVNAVGHAQYLNVARNRVGLSAMAGTASLVFAKAMRMSTFAPALALKTGKKGASSDSPKSAAPKGAPAKADVLEVNLVSTDAEFLMEGSYWGLRLAGWALLVVVAIVLLLEEISYGALAGLATLGVGLWLQFLVGRRQGLTQDRSQTAADARLRVVKEALSGMRSIKFSGSEGLYGDRISSLRAAELNEIRSFRFLWLWNEFLSGAVAVLVVVASIATFVLADLGELTAPKVFTVLALYNTLRPLFQLLPLTITAVKRMQVSVERIARYLDMPELRQKKTMKVESAAGSTGDAPTSDDAPPTLCLRNASFGYPSAPGVLKNLNFDLAAIRAASGKTAPLIGVVGRSASGKSSFLSALAGELAPSPAATTATATATATATVVDLPSLHGHQVALATQTAWIQQATIRDNILFGRPFDQDEYRRVLDATGLSVDCGQFPAGDLSEVGEHGISLSGGQQARLSLARAAYASGNSLVLLDDVLSALDQSVAASVFRDCLQELLGSNTRVVVTHYIHLLAHCDFVVTFQDGAIEAQGTYTDLLETSPSFAALIREYGAQEEEEEHHQEHHQEEQEQEAKQHGGDESKTDGGAADAADVNVKVDLSLAKIVTTEDRDIGAVGGSVYVDYLRAGGGWKMGALVTLGFAATQASVALGEWVLAEWSDDDDPDESHYLTLFTILGFVTSAAVLFRAFWFVIASVTASGRLHRRLARGVLYAPITFHDQTPSGRVLNRFSADTADADHHLPHFLEHCLLCVAQVLTVVVVVSAVVPWFMLAFPVLGFVAWKVARIYHRALRELKRLMSISRSPVLNWFSEAMVGRHVIRGIQQTPNFQAEFERRVDGFASFSFATFAVSWWTGQVMGLLGAVFVGLAAVMAVLTDVSSGQAGFLTNMTLILSLYLGGMVFLSAEVEGRMTSVQRILTYSAGRLPAEADLHNPDAPLPDDWPSKGAVSLEGVTLRYRPALPPAISDVSLSVSPGQRVALAGRTGSGKSTILTALFRLVEPADGSRIVIDGVDVLKVGLEYRQRLQMIAQQPFLVTGTVRDNIDVSGDRSDEDVLDAAQAVGLTRVCPSLDAPVNAGGANLSQGTRQLVCLARALLKQSKVLVMDESTASLDGESDALIQAALAGPRFADTTILFVSHRLHAVMAADTAVVMHNGVVMETGPPAELLRALEVELDGGGGGDGSSGGGGGGGGGGGVSAAASPGSLQHLVAATGRATSRRLLSLANEASQRRLR